MEAILAQVLPMVISAGVGWWLRHSKILAPKSPAPTVPVVPANPANPVPVDPSKPDIGTVIIDLLKQLLAHVLESRTVVETRLQALESATIPEPKKG